MRLKEIILAVGCAAVIGFGVLPGYKQYSGIKQELSAAESESEQYLSVCGDLQAQIDTILNTLSYTGRDACLDKSSVASKLAGVDGAAITGVGVFYSNLQEATELADISELGNVGDDVTAVKYIFSIENAINFLNSIASMDLIVSEVHVDVNAGTASLTVPTVFSSHYGDVSEPVLDTATESLEVSTEL